MRLELPATKKQILDWIKRVEYIKIDLDCLSSTSQRRGIAKSKIRQAIVGSRNEMFFESDINFELEVIGEQITNNEDGEIDE